MIDNEEVNAQRPKDYQLPVGSGTVRVAVWPDGGVTATLCVQFGNKGIKMFYYDDADKKLKETTDPMKATRIDIPFYCGDAFSLEHLAVALSHGIPLEASNGGE